MPELSGVLETSLYVEDLPSSIAFYRGVLGLETLTADERFCAFTVSHQQVLLLFRKEALPLPSATPGGTIPAHGGAGQLHLAFSIPADSLATWECWLQESAIAVESRVTWPRGGTSLYFRDPDEHLIELATPGLWATF